MARGSSSNIQRAKLRRDHSLEASTGWRRGPQLVAQHLAEQRRHLVIGQQMMAHAWIDIGAATPTASRAHRR